MNLQALIFGIINFFQSPPSYSPEKQEEIFELIQPQNQGDSVAEQMLGIACFSGILIIGGILFNKTLIKKENYKCCFCNKPFSKDEIEKNEEILALAKVDQISKYAELVNKKDFFKSVSKILNLAHDKCLKKQGLTLVCDDNFVINCKND